jgi:hypothetical protein
MKESVNGIAKLRVAVQVKNGSQFFFDLRTFNREKNSRKISPLVGTRREPSLLQ